MENRHTLAVGDAIRQTTGVVECQSALDWGSDAILVQLRLFCAD